MGHQDLPTPKYKHGDVVWRGRTVQVRKMLPCPDCLGTQKWKLVTPGGSELEAACQRCSGGWNLRDVPSLLDHTYEAVVDRLTIGSIEVKSKSTFDNDSLVKYMCNETGVGSGSVYSEHDLHPTEEAARAVAEAEAASKEAARASSPERLTKVKFQYLQMLDAALKVADTAVWQSWYRYQNLREDVENELNGASSLSELRENLQSHLDWDKNHRDSERDVFENILEKAKLAAIKWHDEPLLEALQRLPSLKEARRKLMEAQ